MKSLHKLLRLVALMWLACICTYAQQPHSDNRSETAATRLLKQKQKEPTVLPTGVSQDWYEHSLEEIQKREYFIKPVNGSFRFAAANSEQHLGFLFSPNGYSVKNRTQDEGDKPWQVDFQFKGIVRYGQPAEEHRLIDTRNQDNTLEFDFNNYTIQYINDARGMRQNFIVKKPLEGNGNLEVLLDLQGDLQPKMKNNGRLVMYDGKIPQLMYDEIKVWDATHRPLSASMRIRGTNRLVISVDDENAVYPLTIDPLNHAPNWTDNGSGLVFSALNDLTVPLLYGYSVSGAGDLNGDGYDDVIIGAPTYVDVISVSGGTYTTASVGAAFIYFGSASGLSTTPAEILQPTSEVGAQFGFSVSGAGDVNGDGRADVIIGAPGDKVSVTVELSTVSVALGKVYVYYGTQFDGNINTDPTVAASVSLKQSDLGLLVTAPVNALYGFSVSSAGDVNGDGRSDIIVGAPAYTDLLSLNLAGRVDIYHGSASGISAAPSKTIAGGLLNGLFGYSVSSAGKVNNDNYDDIIVGAPASINLLAVGAAYVFHGSASGITASSASGANTSLNAPGLLNKTLFGYSVSSAGDVNADGRGDVIIGEPLALDLFSGSLVAVGRAHIFYGSTTGIQSIARTQLTSPRKPGILGSIAGNLLFGFSVSGVNDINCDGVDDVIIGEPGGTSLSLNTGLLGIVSTNAVSGQAYIFYGKTSAGPVDNPGYTYAQTGTITAANLIGFSVKSSGDVNGDGKPDFLIGAPNGTLNLGSSLTGIIGNTLSYLTTNSVGNAYGYHGCINSIPVAVNDVASTNEDTPVTFSITANDTDADGTINAATVDLDLATAGKQSTISTAAGTWTVSATGNVTYTPILNFHGTTTISYHVSDNSGATSNTATITVTVISVNDLPVAMNDNTTTAEDNAVTLNIISNDTDVDGTIDAATVDLDPVTPGTQGTFINSFGTWSASTGILTYTPAHDFNGVATINYTVKDNEGGTSTTATVSITVTPVNDSPVAVNDNVTTLEDTPISFSVTTNDTDVDGTINAATVDLDPATAGMQTTLTTSSGTWSVSATGIVTYTPVPNFNGAASITYTVNDNSGAVSNIATVVVTVTPVNDAPVAVNDNPTTPEDTPVTFSVTVNDTDADGSIDPATVDLDPSAAGVQNSTTTSTGSWSVDANGNVTYTPALHFNGNATLTYVVKDDSGLLSNSATITVTVTPVNDAPVAINDNATTHEDTPVTFNITSNDTDVDGLINSSTVDLDPATAGIQSTITAASGQWTVNSSGDVTYTPAFNFNGPGNISYTVNDNEGATSNVATLTVTVNAVNDAPVAVNDNATTNEDTPVAFSITSNDSDMDGTIDASTVDLDPASSGIQNSITSNGVWSVNASGVVTYQPASNYYGIASITYTVKDNDGATSNVAVITVTVTSVNDAPVAVADNLSGGQNLSLHFNVTANDTDVDGTIDASTVDLDPVTAGVQTLFVNGGGNWSVDGSGNVTYTPTLNFTGTTAITYTVKDNDGLVSNAGTITLTLFTVAPTNVLPVAVNDNGTTHQGTAVTFSITANDTDADGTINSANVDLDLGTAGLQNSFSNGAGTWNVNNTGYLTFTPVPAFFGTASLSYTVEDNSGATSNPAVITIAVNATPVANDDNPVTNEDTPLTFSVTSNDVDPDGSIHAASVDLDPAITGIQNTLFTANGNWSVSLTGDVTFTPAPDFYGSTSITYNVKDDKGALSNHATITLTVNSVNDFPVAVNDNVTTNEDTFVTFNITSNDTDIDGTIDPATVDLEPANAGTQTSTTTTTGTWSVNNAGDVSFTPSLNFNGTASITYTVNDNGGATSNIATISVTVTPVNDAPVAVNDTPVTDEDTPVIFNVTVNDTDVDGTINDSTVDLDPLTAGIQPSVTDASGTWTVDVNGNITYTPALNFNGPAIITYTVNDNSGATSNTGTVTVTVGPVNDPPVAVADNTTIAEDAIALLNVVANDTDVDGTINMATVDLNPSLAGIQNTITTTAGIWTVNSIGEVTFTPAADFNGTATVTYTVNDNSGATSSPATISIIVTPINDLPVANNDNPVTPEDTPITFSVAANDVDVDGSIDASTVDLDPSTGGIQKTLTNATGVWSVSSSGVVTYTPVTNFNGTGSVTYTVNDNTGLTSNTATISVTVTPVNDAPIAVNDSETTDANIAVTFSLTANDYDIDGTINPATIDLDPAASGIQSLLNTTKGIWSISALGEVTFTPASAFFGTATIDYTVKDNDGAISNGATVTITVNFVNTAPVAVNDGTTTPKNTAITFNIAANDSDIDNNLDLTSIDIKATRSGSRTYSSTEGTWEISITGNVTFTPAPDFVGVAQVPYTITDIMGKSSNEALINVNVIVPFTKTVADYITGLAKAVSTPVVQADGSSKMTFTFTVQNYGTQTVNQIEINDDLSMAFPAPATYTIVSGSANGDLIYNTAFNGGSNTNLLASGSKLAAGAKHEVVLTLLVHPNGKPGIYNNVALVTVKSDDNTIRFTDTADEGTNPDANGNGNPSDPGEDDATSISILSHPGIVVAKDLEMSPVKKSDCTYDVTFRIVIKNTGNVDFKNITLTDNLQSGIIAPSDFSLVSITSSDAQVNTGFNGKQDKNILLPGSALNRGDSLEITYVINIVPNDFYGPYSNTISVKATDGNHITTEFKSQSISFQITPLEVWIPEGFSPNGDGIHDFFEITLTCGLKAKLTVFNRWGEKVYHSNDYQNDWGGQSNEGNFLNKLLPEGTYFFTCELSSGTKTTNFITINH